MAMPFGNGRRPQHAVYAHGKRQRHGERDKKQNVAQDRGDDGADGLARRLENSDVIFTEQVNVTNIRNMRNVLTAKSLYSIGSEYLGAPNMPTTASGASSNNSVATSPIATVHSRI